MSLLVLLRGSGGAEEPTPAPDLGRVAVTQEYAPPQTVCIVRDPETGEAMARWASDEPEPENVLQGIHLKGQMPGGKKEATGGLGRDPRTPWGDMVSFADVEFQLPGRQLIWSGRFTKAPKSDGDTVSITGVCSGWQSALEDTKAALAGIISKEHSRWTDPSAARKLELASNNLPLQGGPESSWDTTSPALRLVVRDAWESPVIPCAEAWFDAGPGNRIGRVLASWEGWPDLGMVLERIAANTDIASGGFQGGGDVYTAVKGTIDYSPPVPSRRFLLNWRFASTGAGFPGGEFPVSLRDLTVIGDHGLALRGTWPNVGYSSAQILGWAVPALASPLEVDPELLDDDGILVEQAWYDQLPNTAADIVRDVLRLGVLDWFVKTLRRFELRRPGTYGRTWMVTSSSSGLQEEAQDADRSWEAMWGRYNDVDGTQKTVGPPGSGADFESELLRITDPDHPAVRADVVREDLLDLQAVSTPQRAVEITAEFLREANELSRAGRIVLNDHVMDEDGVFWPVGMVAEGDQLVVTDARDRSPRKIVDYDYDDEAKAVSCSLDAPPEALKALQERYRAALIPLGFG